MKRKHTVLAALWCLLNTKGYPQCVLRAVALSDDTDTIAAVAGPLVGLWYGSKQIPAVWELKTAKYEEIKEKTKQFYTVCMGMQHEESFYKVMTARLQKFTWFLKDVEIVHSLWYNAN